MTTDTPDDAEELERYLAEELNRARGDSVEWEEPGITLTLGRGEAWITGVPVAVER